MFCCYQRTVMSSGLRSGLGEAGSAPEGGVKAQGLSNHRPPTGRRGSRLGRDTQTSLSPDTSSSSSGWSPRRSQASRET
ncbi:hypothetical protein ATANTOWER_005718 [Ataeniobius toweri]|uniref:Uncharacterized protein n=1 Tax=Ataeniobius toweri TaxID=208326 RepID=A0ABU7AX01_9TELE|nr:hypothetical protein [Ataeniobius toweri]